MNRLGLIIKREYLSIVAKKSFFILTLLLPLLGVLVMIIPAVLSSVNDGDRETVALVDEAGQYASLIKDTEDFKFVAVNDYEGKNLREYYEKENSELYAIVVIPKNVSKTKSFDIYSSSSVKKTLVRYMENSLEDIISDEKIEAYNVPGLKEMIAESRVEMNSRTILWDAEGEEKETSALISQILGLILALTSYSFVLMYGSMIMNGVIEEKTNRIVEVIVSSCKPVELMIGKIAGVALVGLTQLVIWGVMMTIVSLVFGVGSLFMSGGAESVDAINQVNAAGGDQALNDILASLSGVNFGQILLAFALYGIGGFLLYAAMFAALGSAVDQPNDASQFMMPIMLIMIFALWAGMSCIENPNGPLAFWTSMIPFTSPVVMMTRLPFSVPWWEIALSVAILFATAIGCVFLAARIYRKGILKYGKKASWLDLIKWIK